MAERVNEKEENHGREELESSTNPSRGCHEKVKQKDESPIHGNLGVAEGLSPDNATKEQNTHDRPCLTECGGLDGKKSECIATNEENKDTQGTEKDKSAETSTIKVLEDNDTAKVGRSMALETSDNLAGSNVEGDVQSRSMQRESQLAEAQTSKENEDQDHTTAVQVPKLCSGEEGASSTTCVLTKSNNNESIKEDTKINLAEVEQKQIQSEPKLDETAKANEIKDLEENLPKCIDSSVEKSNTVKSHESGNTDPKSMKENLDNIQKVGKDISGSKLMLKGQGSSVKKLEDLQVGGKSPTFDKLVEHHQKLGCEKMVDTKDAEKTEELSSKVDEIDSKKDVGILSDKENFKESVEGEVMEDNNRSENLEGKVKDNRSKIVKDKKGRNKRQCTKAENEGLVEEFSDVINKKGESEKSDVKQNMGNESKAVECFSGKSLKQKVPDIVKEESASDEESNDKLLGTLDINGESSSLKSEFSEDSDKCSESEPSFTKRASNDPNFAVVYSFLSLFGGLLNLPECSLDELERCLDNSNDLHLQAENHGLLEKLHLKLLRRLSRSSKTQFSSLGQVSNERLIKNLIKFSKYIDLDLAWDLEKFGYHVLGSAERLLLLKALCEVHFDENPRFKIHFTDEYIKSDKIETLRLVPTGFDMKGKSFWYQQDSSAGFRLYSVEEDDEEGCTWKLLASTMEDFEQLIESLKTKSEVNPKDVALAKRKERVEKRRAKLLETQAKKKGKKKSKTAKKKKDASDSDSDENDDNPCAHCYSNKRPDLVLLCDKCDAAYHTLCLRPPLMSIPEGDWLCPFCQQLVLIDVLQDKHKDLATKRKAMERMAKRAVFDDIRLSNIVEGGGDDDSRRSGRKRSKIDYNFQNYNDMISAALSTVPSQPRSEVSTRNFYSTSHQSGRRTRRLNNLDDDSMESNLSEYENSPSESERHAREHEDSVSRGCRRSRRLKRKYGDDDEKSESSESESDAFVRRSTRRRRPTSKSYMEYESDDTPEEVLMKNIKGEENDEYVASESEEDPEDLLNIRKRRAIVSDGEDDEEETVEDEVETDFEDEEICADMEKNIVSDDSEDDVVLSLSEEEEPEASDSGDSITDDEKYEEDSNSSKKEKKKSKDVQEKKRGGKDMRTIMKSIREEEEGITKKVQKVEEAKITSSTDADVQLKVEPVKSEGVVAVNEEGTQEKRETEPPLVEDGANDVKDHVLSEVVVKCDEEEDNTKKEEKPIANYDTNPPTDSESCTSSRDMVAKEELEEKAAKPPDLSSSESKITRKELTLPLKASGGHHKPKVRSERSLAMRELGIDAPVQRPGSSVQLPRASTHSQETMELTSHSQPMRHSLGATYGQGPTPMVPMSHQRDILRPRPYAAEVMRPTDHYNQPIGNFSPMHNPYHMQSPYHNYMEQQSFYAPNMQPYPRSAPPAYPGYAGGDPQALWRPQGMPPMQWNYPPYHAGSPHVEQKRSLPMHHPAPDAHLYRGSNGSPPVKVSKTQSRFPGLPSLSAESSPRRSKTSSVDSRKPSTMESYAAFRNMVIAPSDDRGPKKAKRT